MTLEQDSAPLAAPPRTRFSTDALPENERIAFFREEIARMLQLDVELLEGSDLRYQVDSLDMGSVAVGAVRSSATRFARTRGCLADADSSFLFVVHTHGAQEIAHNRQTTTLEPGDACLIEAASVGCTTFFGSGGGALGVRIDGNALRSLVREPEARAGALIRRDRPGMGLLRRYLDSVLKDGDLTPDLLRAAGRHVTDIVASILGATPDGAAQAEAGGLRAARLKRVLEEIATRCCEPGFSIETVATEFAVSSRTIQLALQETGQTFSEHMCEHRLRRAWRMLADPGSQRSIAEIAYEAGFNDLSHFYRAFRRRFGETPAAVRGSRSALH